MKIESNVIDELYLATKEERKSFLEESKEWFYYTGIINAIETLQTIDSDIVPHTGGDSLKEYALSIIEDLEDDGYDLTEGSWCLQWKYEERPDIPVTLIIGEFEDIEESDPGRLN